MKKINKLIKALAFTALFAATPMFAQGIPSQSNGYAATAQTIKTDKDKYLDIRYFNDLSFDNIFVTSDFTDSNFDIGVATKVKDFYLATYYYGNLWHGIRLSTDNKSEGIFTDNLKNDKDDKTESTLKKGFDFTNSNMSRTIFLVGLPNKMGIKLDADLRLYLKDFKENSKKINKEENKSTENIYDPIKNTEYKPLKEDNTYGDINLYWSCFDISVNNTNIKPWAGLGFEFDNYYKEWQEKNITKEIYVENPYKNVDTVTTYNKQEQNSNTKKHLKILLGSDFEIKHNDIAKSLFVLHNTFINNFYFNKPITVVKTTLVDNLNPKKNNSEETTTNITDRIYVKNGLDTSYRFEIKPIEKLTIGARFNLNTTVEYKAIGNNIKTTIENKDGVNTVTTTKNEEIESIFKDGVLVDQGSPYISLDKSNKTITTKFDTYFGIGASYAVKPNFAINIGYSGELPDIKIVNSTDTTKETKTTYDFTNPLKPEVLNVETKNKSEKKVTRRTPFGYQSNFDAGFIWNMNDCCNLDLRISISKNPSLEELWDAGWFLGFTFKK